MRLRVSDVLEVMSMARKFYVDCPAAATLPEMTRSLNEGERLAMSYLHAALNLANRKGLLRTDLKPGELDVEYETADSAADLDIAESESGAGSQPKTFAKGFTQAGP